MLKTHYLRIATRILARNKLYTTINVLAGLGAVGIALITVSLQSIRAAMANPINNLRSE